MLDARTLNKDIREWAIKFLENRIKDASNNGLNEVGIPLQKLNLFSSNPSLDEENFASIFNNNRQFFLNELLEAHYETHLVEVLRHNRSGDEVFATVLKINW